MSFEKPVSFSDDPPPPPGILSKKESGRGGSSIGGRGGSLKLPDHGRTSSEEKKRSSERNSMVSMEPELFNQLRGLQKSARELRQASFLITLFQMKLLSEGCMILSITNALNKYKEKNIPDQYKSFMSHKLCSNSTIIFMTFIQNYFRQ